MLLLNSCAHKLPFLQSVKYMTSIQRMWIIAYGFAELKPDFIALFLRKVTHNPPLRLLMTWVIWRYRKRDFSCVAYGALLEVFDQDWEVLYMKRVSSGDVLCICVQMRVSVFTGTCTQAVLCNSSQNSTAHLLRADMTTQRPFIVLYKYVLLLSYPHWFCFQEQDG